MKYIKFWLYSYGSLALIVPLSTYFSDKPYVFWVTLAVYSFLFFRGLNSLEKYTWKFYMTTEKRAELIIMPIGALLVGLIYSAPVFFLGAFILPNSFSVACGKMMLNYLAFSAGLASGFYIGLYMKSNSEKTRTCNVFPYKGKKWNELESDIIINILRDHDMFILTDEQIEYAKNVLINRILYPDTK